VKKSILGAVALASLAVPAISVAAAAAPAPKFATDLIVPNKSLGGLVLGSTPAAARKVFGAKDCNSSGCTYTGSGGVSANVIFATTKTVKKPFVGRISITGGLTGGSAGPFGALKTAKGIGIGSTAQQVKAAYPHATGSVKLGGFSIKGPGEHATGFTLGSGKVTSITMESVSFG
jgi:hypothetical protein